MLTYLRQTKTRPALPPPPRRILPAAVASIFDRAPGPTVAADGTQVVLLDCTPDPTITASLKTAQYAKLGTCHPEGFRQSAGEGYTRMDVVFSVSHNILQKLGTAAPALRLPVGPELADALEREKKDRDGKPWKQILESQVKEHASHAGASGWTPARREAQATHLKRVAPLSYKTPASYQTPAFRASQSARNSTPGGRAAQAKRATKKPSLDPKEQARRDKVKMSSRMGRKMRSLGFVNIEKRIGRPAQWVRPGEQA